MIETHRRKSGLRYRVKRKEGALQATFRHRGVAELQDALWARWGGRVPVLDDREPKLPLPLRARLLSPDTVDLSEGLLGDLLAHHPAASPLAGGGAPMLGEYIVDRFFPVWAQGRIPGARPEAKATKTVAEMKRALNRLVFELEREQGEAGGRGRASAAPAGRWGTDAIAWTPLDQVTAKQIQSLDQKVKEAGVGHEVWRKVLNFLSQLFDYALLDAQACYPESRTNPARRIRPPRQATRRRRALLPDNVEAIGFRFLELAALSEARRKRCRGGARVETPGGVPIPASPEYALDSVDLIRLLGYGGFRPSEALGATAGAYDPAMPGYVRIDRRNVQGVILSGTKSTRYPQRHVKLLGPLEETIERRAHAAAPDGLLFHRPGGDEPWTASDYRNWARRYYGPIARSLGLDEQSDDPYALRHSYASVRTAAGHPKRYIDESMGSTLSDTVYTTIHHELEAKGLSGGYEIDTEIARARASELASLRERLLRDHGIELERDCPCTAAIATEGLASSTAHPAGARTPTPARPGGRRPGHGRAVRRRARAAAS